MRVFILSAINSIHTQRWVNALAENGMEIFLFSVHGSDDNFLKNYANVQIYVQENCLASNSGLVEKLCYLSTIRIVKKKIKEFAPDILHAHYASSYGLIGALSEFHPYIISLWGSDIYKFPQASFLNRTILKFNLNKGDKILSTSNVMATEARKYTDKSISVTPFGVDIDLFKPKPGKVSDEFVIGTVKTLSYNYGIDLLIRSFKILTENNSSADLKLVVVGEGPDKTKLIKLTEQLGISSKVSFVGRIENSLLPDYYNYFDVAVSLSRSESFGVVAIEAMACECPVVVSDADGFTEVVLDRQTGIIVPKNNAEAAAGAIQKLIDNTALRSELGQNGRSHVENFYTWKNNVATMINMYEDTIEKAKNKSKDLF